MERSYAGIRKLDKIKKVITLCIVHALRDTHHTVAVRAHARKKTTAMRKKNIKIIAVLIAIFSLSSCDYLYDYTYQVKNETDSQLSIELKSHMIDSVYMIGANETKILFITDHGVEGSKGPYFKDVSFDLKRFVVTKDDTLVSSKNYLVNSSWNYDNGLYSTTVNNEEFK